ncbi:MAG: hypothetical protein RTV41_15235 [Candidatus Thorarchaeota archaeon]
MNYYNQQGPAQYAQHQQSRKDQQMSNLLRMMMQMKSFKERQRQFDIGQESAQKTQDWREQYQQSTMDYQKFLMNPEMQAAMARRKAEGRAAGEGDVLPEPGAILPAPIRTWAKSRAGGGWTEDQLNQLDDVTKRGIINQWRKANEPTTPDKPPTGQTAFLNKINQNINQQINRIAKDKGAVSTMNPFTRDFSYDFGEKPEPMMVGFLNEARGLITNWVNITTERKLSREEMTQARKANSFLSNLNKYESDIEKFLTDPTVPPEMKTPAFIFSQYLDYTKK